MKKLLKLTLVLLLLCFVLASCGNDGPNHTQPPVTQPSTTQPPVTQPSTTQPIPKPTPETNGSRGLEFALNEDGQSYSVVGIGTCTDKELVIPDTYEGFPVTSIGNSAFYGCTSLTSIEIPDSVTSIGEHAFDHCTRLTSVTIPDSVTTIAFCAFDRCTSLTSITIPESVTSVADHAFNRCISLVSIEVNGNNEYYKSIDGNLYDKDGKTLIQYAIGKKDTTFSIPSFVTSIGASAFDSCRSLTSIEIPDSVNSIGGGAFSDCSSLVSVVIPDSVTRIDYSTFNGCSSLTSITIPNSITSIEGWAFANCSSLVSIEIPASVMTIGSQSTFDGCTSLTSITIPDSVESIGRTVFKDCTSLKSVIFGKNSQLTSIDDYAFGNCISLESIIFGENSKLTNIGTYAFLNCDSLSKINYGGTADQWSAIDKGTAWNSFNSDYNIYATDAMISKYGIATYYSVGLEFAFNEDGQSYYVVGIGTCTDTALVIPYKHQGLLVTEIGDMAFSEMDFENGVFKPSFLKSVIIPDGVTKIGEGAFHSCLLLQSVSIGNSVEAIENAAFSCCASITSIEIPASVRSIGDGAFIECFSLIEICNKSSLDITVGSYDYGHIGCFAKQIITDEEQSNLKSVGDYIFWDDGTDVYLVKYLGDETQITLPEYEGGKEYGIWMGMFCYNDNMTSVIIPDFVTSIGRAAFGYCTSLTSVTLGDSVMNIEDYAFDGCGSLIEICNKSSLNISAVQSNDYGCVGCWAKHIITDEAESNLSYVGDYIFWDDGTEVYLVKYIGDDTEITLPEYEGGKEYGIWQCAFVEPFNHVKTRITNIIIPDFITSIGDTAFWACTSLASIVIPESVTSIGEGAFFNCTSLTSITIPDSVTSIGDDAFYNCISLTSVKIPNFVTSIGYNTFRGCTSLTTITIPNSVTSIGSSAFSGCTALVSVMIFDTVMSIDYYAFKGCTSLTIYCEVDSQPEGWNSYWNPSDRPVVWNYKSE